MTFSYGFDDKNIEKKNRSHVQYILLDIILAWWRRPVASSKALDLLHWAMRVVLYRRTAAAINMATFLGVFVGCCLFACCSGGHWGNMEQVIARWWRPVAPEVALDMLHWAMPSVLLRRICKAFETAATEVHFDVIVDFVIDHNHS